MIMYNKLYQLHTKDWMEFNQGKKMFSEWEDGPFVWWLKLNLLVLKKYEIQAVDNRTKQGH